MGWVFISLLERIFPYLQMEKSLYGTLLTLIIFLIIFPYWSNFRWNKNLSQAIGIIKFKDKYFFKKLLLEFFKALLIVTLISIPLIISGFAILEINLDKFVFFNSLILGILVGFAEELIFRVWLFEELYLNFSFKKANFLQASIFAIVHLRFDLSILSNIQILVGLFLLGNYLNNWRRGNCSSILLAMVFHGSIVSFWFFINNSLLNIQENTPQILFGPGQGNNINPIGGLIGICILIYLNYSKSLNCLNAIFNILNFPSGSSSKDTK